MIWALTFFCKCGEVSQKLVLTWRHEGALRHVALLVEEDVIEVGDQQQFCHQGVIPEASVQGLDGLEYDGPGMLLCDGSAKAAQDLPQREASGSIQLAPGPVVSPLSMHVCLFS